MPIGFWVFVGLCGVGCALVCLACVILSGRISEMERRR